MSRWLRPFLFVLAVVQALFAVAFIFQFPFAVQLWPFPNTTPLSFLFTGSVFLAAALAMLWILYSREDGALAAIALDYLLIFTPIAIYAFQIAGDNVAILVFAIVVALNALFGLGLFLYSRRIPLRDVRPAPRLVRWSFVVFTITLIVVGVQMVLRADNRLPWAITPDLSVLFGWFFIGASAFFAYAVVRPFWSTSGGPLMGFVAYDVVLLLPFLQRLPTISDEFRVNMILYLIVLIYSAILSIYYLFINPATRMFGARMKAEAA